MKFVDYKNHKKMSLISAGQYKVAGKNQAIQTLYRKARPFMAVRKRVWLRETWLRCTV